MKHLDDKVKKCLEILQNKKNKLEDIFKFTTLQKQAIEKEDDDKLKECIDKKQSLINEIDKLDEKFISEFSFLKSQLGVNSLEDLQNTNNQQLKNLKVTVLDINNLIEKIFLLEKENSVKIKKIFDDIKGKLKEISGGKKAINAYGGHKMPNGGGAFIDNKK